MLEKALASPAGLNIKHHFPDGILDFPIPSYSAGHQQGTSSTEHPGARPNPAAADEEGEENNRLGELKTKHQSYATAFPVFE